MMIVLLWFVPITEFLTPSTSLKDESIGPFSIGNKIDEQLLSLYGINQKDKQPGGYGYSGDDIYIKTDYHHYIESISISNHLETSRGIKTGNIDEDVITAYGNNYYTYKEMGLGEAIEYKDKKQRIKLTAWTVENEVKYIWLFSY